MSALRKFHETYEDRLNCPYCNPSRPRFEADAPSGWDCALPNAMRLAASTAVVAAFLAALVLGSPDVRVAACVIAGTLLITIWGGLKAWRV